MGGNGEVIFSGGGRVVDVAIIDNFDDRAVSDFYDKEKLIVNGFQGLRPIQVRLLSRRVRR